MIAPYQRKLAHLATVPGGSRKGENTFRRSRRQRQKAFEEELDALVLEAARKYDAKSPDDMPWEAMAELHNAIEAAQVKWLVD